MIQTELKIGDTVEIISGLGPALQFVIDSFETHGNDVLACGSYGCINVDVLQKVTVKDNK